MVRVDLRDDVGVGVVVVTLDRPDRRNAVDHDTLLALLEVQAAHRSARVVVLTGTPPAFSAGADLHGVEQGVFAADLARALRGFTEWPAPVIGAIDGPALGAGAQLAAVCDLRVATPDSVIGVPAARLGLVVDHWTVERLAREFGWPVARAMLLGAETYRGAQLHAMGSVHRLGGLDTALEWAAAISRLAPLTIAGHKLALESSAGEPDHDPLVEDARRRAWSSVDAEEGRMAFLEKRAATFRGE
ncbi:MAG TPA: enoyl-CoA hydratase-related protein [Ilumatobacter sp.]